MTDAASLAGITVLDLGQIYNGPYATFLVAMSRFCVRDGLCVRDGHWRSLLKALGRTIFWSMRSLKPADEGGMQEVDDIVSAWTRRHGNSDVLEKLQAGGVPSAMVRDVAEVLADQHMHDRGMLRDVDHPVMGEVTLMNSPLNIAMGETIEARLPPALGEHNQLVYGQLLGLSQDDIAELVKTGLSDLRGRS